MPTSTRYLTVLALLAIGCVLACKKRDAATSTEPLNIKKGITAIVVGPKSCDLNYPNVQISKIDGEVAIWVAKNKTAKLRIEFDEEIFEGMDNINGKWIPKDCGQSRICYSGDVKPSVVPSEREYKYGQVLIDQNNNEDSCDGRMIINP